MNFKKTFFCLSLLTGMALTSCSDSEGNITVPVNFTVSVTMPSDGDFKSDIVYAGQEIQLVNGSTVVATAVTDDNGTATFQNIIPEIYDLSTSWSISGSEYVQMVNEITENTDVVISATKIGVVVATEGQEVVLEGLFSVKQSLLFSKVYYATTKDNNNNKNYAADAYIEIFNNSDEVVYIDGIYLGMMDTFSGTADAYFASEQSSTDYLYAKQIFRFPGSGTDYPVEPGKYILIANSAKNHLEESDTSVDLSGADFEAKNVTYVNNPDVPAIELLFTYTPLVVAINLGVGGPNSMVLFKTDENIDNWEEVPPYEKDYNVNQWLKMIPTSTVIDGVEILKNATTGVDTSQKRLFDFIDAGYTHIEGVSGRTAELVCRKVASEANGRYYLTDTNNSVNDFYLTTTSDIKPGEYGKE